MIGGDRVGYAALRARGGDMSSDDEGLPARAEMWAMVEGLGEQVRRERDDAEGLLAAASANRWVGGRLDAGDIERLDTLDAEVGAARERLAALQAWIDEIRRRQGKLAHPVGRGETLLDAEIPSLEGRALGVA